MPASQSFTPIHTALENREVTDELRRFIRAKLSQHERSHSRIEDETDDALQNVSIRALEKSSQFDSMRGCAVAWLKGVANRVITDQYRREQKFRMVLEELVEEARQVRRAKGRVASETSASKYLSKMLCKFEGAP
jgi:DNA-directed RNA polymerase specialized sigma24 family protein